MTRPRLVLTLVALAAGTLPARGAEEPKAQGAAVTTAYDLVYRKAGDTELKLDIARPSEGDGPFPLVLAIHGGAWRAGSKNDMRGLLQHLAASGFVAASPQYRFCPKETFPAQVHDVKAAVRWLKGHAKEYKIDADHVGAIGFSAGGHLALMLGVTSPEDGLEGDAPKEAPSTKIHAVVNYFGPTDLAAHDIPDASLPLIKDFLGGSAKDKPKEAAKASPLTYVSRDDAPILTFQGTKDNLVPYTQATKLTDAQTKAGVPGRVELLLGAGHGWSGRDLARTAEESIEFFNTHLKPSKR